MASDVRIGGAVQRGLGEAAFDHLGSDEDRRPRPQTEDTGLTSTSRTAGCGPACPVVWQGRAVIRSPYADLPPDGHLGPLNASIQETPLANTFHL